MAVKVAFDQPVKTSERHGALATYYAFGLGYTPYATPEDMLVISGSATKIVRVINMRLLIHATAGALQVVRFIKRSVANTGGTATNPTGNPADSSDAAATAVLSLYSALPTLGSGSVHGQVMVLSTAPTAVPGLFNLSNVGVGALLINTAPTQFVKPVTLRGVNESLASNFNSVALPAGFTVAMWEVLWTESDT